MSLSLKSALELCEVNKIGELIIAFLDFPPNPGTQCQVWEIAFVSVPLPWVSYILPVLHICHCGKSRGLGPLFGSLRVCSVCHTTLLLNKMYCSRLLVSLRALLASS